MFQKLRQTIVRVHNEGVAVSKKINQFITKEAALRLENKRNREQLARDISAQANKPITMYDSVNVNAIPANAIAVAGYVGGLYPTFRALLQRFPHAKHLSIAINAAEVADCLDVETGDATPGEAPDWVRREKAHRKPWVYANASTMPAVIAALDRAGLHRNEYYLWVADYNGVAQIPNGYDAKQYEERKAADIDLSVVRSGIL